MKSELIRIGDLSDRDLQRWRELAATAIEPNPFHEPDFQIPAAKHLDSADVVRLLVVMHDRRWLAALPVCAMKRWYRVPFRSWGNWRGAYGFFGTPLLSPDQPEGAMNALLAGLLACPGCEFAALEWVTDEGPIAELLRDTEEAAGIRSECFERFERGVIRRLPGGPPAHERLPTKRRSEARRRRKKLTAELGAEPAIRERQGDEVASRRFLALEGSGWKGREGTAIESNPADVDFFLEMCRNFATRGRLQLLTLEHEGRVLAAQCNLIAGDAIFGFKTAYDESLARFAPGVQLNVEALKRFDAHSELKIFDSCTQPSNEMISHEWPDHRAICTKAIAAPKTRGRLAMSGVRAVRSLRQSGAGRRLRTARRRRGHARNRT